jgi:hypothetical protein
MAVCTDSKTTIAGFFTRRSIMSMRFSRLPT